MAEEWALGMRVRGQNRSVALSVMVDAGMLLAGLALAASVAAGPHGKMQASSGEGGGVTRLGSNCLLMTCAHIGHDSQVGSHCILANAATLAGHVVIEDYATVGAFSPVHQHCTVGQYAFIGGGTIVTQDVLPFSKTSGRRENKAFGVNSVGLQRRGFSPERIRSLQRAFRLLRVSKLNTTQALEKIRELEGEDVALLVGFIERSERGVIK